MLLCLPLKMPLSNHSFRSDVVPYCRMLYLVFSYFMQIIPIIGVALTGANLVGYVKCRRDAGAKISAMAGQFIGKQVLNQVTFGCLIRPSLNAKYYLQYMYCHACACVSVARITGVLFSFSLSRHSAPKKINRVLLFCTFSFMAIIYVCSFSHRFLSVYIMPHQNLIIICDVTNDASGMQTRDMRL